MEDLIIRPYTKNDRETVLRISADTAVFGEPVEAILEDRQVFCDAFTAYYTDYESEYAWAACIEGQVVGYLTGCINTSAQRKRWLRQVLPALLSNLAQRRYTTGRKTWRYTWSMIGGTLRKEFPHVDHREYPAHLHINVEAGARGRGLGRRLLETYLDQLHQLEIPGVFLDTTNINEAACKLYEGVGFEILERRETNVWKEVIQKPVENIVYGMKMLDDR
jgi:ribosomal protein S18 acetylase RimI-like enzyme